MPDEAFALPRAEREKRASLSANLCVLDNERHFIRCVLNVRVEDCASEFAYGPWIEVDRATFNRYAVDLDGGSDGSWDGAPGRIANAFPAFTPVTLGLACTIRRPSDVEQRPFVEITDECHPLGAEQREGMPYARAIEVASHMKGFVLIVD